MKTFICLALSLTCVLGSSTYTTEPKDQTMYYGGGYNGAIFAENVTEYITYDSKTEDEYALNGGLPKYYDTSTRVKTCANVAGTILLGYYDKSFSQLIPNFTSTRVIKDRILYSSQTEAVQNVMDQLYESMETNSTTAGGTSVSGFQSGLKSYVNKQGQNVAFNSIGDNGILNKQAVINSIQNERPVALFVSRYSLISIGDFSISDNQDRLYKSNYSGNHVLIGYGIKEVNYYNSDGALDRQIILLMVATGYRQDQLSYIDVTDGGFIEGYSVNIY